MSDTPNSKEPDPELTDMNALRHAEEGRAQPDTSRRGGGTLIVITALVVLALALAVVVLVTRG